MTSPRQGWDEARDWVVHMEDRTVEPQVIIQRYGQTSEQYEENMVALNYHGAAETALALAKLFPSNRKTVRILDIAAGTGLCAVEFYKQGFRNMDALEPSSEMRETARRKGLYNQYFTSMMGDNTLDIPTDTYDAVAMSSFCTNIMRQLPIKSFEEIIRIVKPGGYVINTGFYTTYVDGQASTENFRQNLRTLESRGQWKQIEIKHFPEYLYGKDGGVSIHRVM